MKLVNRPFDLTLLDLFFNDDFTTNNVEKSPEYDIIEENDKYHVEFMLSGFDKENISAKVEENSLIVKGERKVPENLKYSRKGSFYGKFEKIFTLPDNIISDKINASFKNGILKVEIPKDVQKELCKVIEIN